ncbi:MAG: 2-succinyl-5-enolpyruvyl-6-hydroxy-3-cyclohexene-1-carboxylate synthase [Petrimonas sp.]|uniref:thiamine pyrophosphate-binding protein n=1 Tax=Petrimonas sp. TaxID=2023866 RepID=UPI0030D35B09
MSKYYSDEKNVQIIVALLKKHGIRKVIASPGSANSPLVASLQHDSYFEIYSSVDERSAAYIACGLAAESKEPVVISSTGATASRNYMPGLTEAYYRKLPILAITSTRNVALIGSLTDQVIDRSIIPNDIAQISVTLPIIKDENDIWECEIKVNSAILALTRHGGGPAHINLPTNYLGTYNTIELPFVRIIKRITENDEFPIIPNNEKIAVFVGSHKFFDKKLTNALEFFCETHNAVVLCDHTSNYYGKYKILLPIIAYQSIFQEDLKIGLLIHIGEISSISGYLMNRMKSVWRLSEDGEIRDTFRKLEYVFEMPEEHFFNKYTTEHKKNHQIDLSYFDAWNKKEKELSEKIPNLPFSNIWIAQEIAYRIPKHSTIHFAILNSLRSWNFFSLPESVISNSNVGGFGIDGSLSSIIGASLTNKTKLFYCVIGDLAFFYDMNALGNRHIGNNLRLLIINNGKGTEFRLFLHRKGTAQFEEKADKYISAAGHFGNKSRTLLRNYAEDLNFTYMTAANKDEFAKVIDKFVNPNIQEKSIIFEVFTDSVDENTAIEELTNLELPPTSFKMKMKQKTKDVLGEKNINLLKRIIK